MNSPLRDFDGDLGFLHDEEGHRGKPYYPGGEHSGVTFDPGADLAHIEGSLLELYRPLLTDEQTRPPAYFWACACRMSRPKRR